MLRIQFPKEVPCLLKTLPNLQTIREQTALSQSNFLFVTTAGEMFLSNLNGPFIKYSPMCFGHLHTYSRGISIRISSQAAGGLCKLFLMSNLAPLHTVCRGGRDHVAECVLDRVWTASEPQGLVITQTLFCHLWPDASCIPARLSLLLI